MNISAYTLKSIAECKLLSISYNADQSLFNEKQKIGSHPFSMRVSQAFIIIKILPESS